MMSTENDHHERLGEWREEVGIRVMRAMTCTHDGDEFGSKAVCVTCFANTQRIGALMEHVAAVAWEQGRRAERRDWELTADLVTPDEDRSPTLNPYRPPAPLRRSFDLKTAEHLEAMIRAARTEAWDEGHGSFCEDVERWCLELHPNPYRTPAPARDAQPAGPSAGEAS